MDGVSNGARGRDSSTHERVDKTLHLAVDLTYYNLIAVDSNGEVEDLRALQGSKLIVSSKRFRFMRLARLYPSASQAANKDRLRI